MFHGRIRRPIVRALACCLALSGAAAAAQAQSCQLGPISYVFIDNQSIFDVKNTESSRFSWFYRAANNLHVRTRRAVVARELLFGPGDCFDPVMIEESERLLRAYDFLAQVEIYGIPQPDNSYHVIVNTRDEWSTQPDVRISLDNGLSFEGARLREANLLGRGESLSAYYVKRDVTRDYGVRFTTHQLAGTRWDLDLSLGRTRAGTVLAQSVAYPFVGEVSRWSARQAFSREDRFFDYIAGELDDETLHVLVPVRDKRFDLSVVTRLGHRGNLTLIGGSLTHHELTYPGLPRLAHDDDVSEEVVHDTTLTGPALALREDLSSIRLGVVLGQRNLWFVKRRGYDSMRGQQDVRLGAEGILSIARSIPSLEVDNDLFSTFAFYSGFELRDVLVSSRARLDARRDFEAVSNSPEWEDVYGEAEVLAYWRPRQSVKHTILLRASGAGGWHTSTPFQLTLGGDRNLRGYREDRFPGGRRLILTAEDRMYWGWPRPEVLDLGSTAFVDFGRIWPGDAPYGVDSSWQTTVGFGLRASFPAGSRTTYRIDFALPVKPGPNFSDMRLMISVGEQIGMVAPFGDFQLNRSRYEAAGGQLLRFRQ